MTTIIIVGQTKINLWRTYNTSCVGVIPCKPENSVSRKSNKRQAPVSPWTRRVGHEQFVGQSIVEGANNISTQPQAVLSPCIGCEGQEEDIP
jgi:hypothetical protein